MKKWNFTRFNCSSVLSPNWQYLQMLNKVLFWRAQFKRHIGLKKLPKTLAFSSKVGTIELLVPRRSLDYFVYFLIAIEKILIRIFFQFFSSFYSFTCYVKYNKTKFAFLKIYSNQTAHIEKIFLLLSLQKSELYRALIVQNWQISNFIKTARIRAKPWMFRLPFKVYGAIITLKN